MEHTEGMEIYNNQGKFICKIEPPVTYKDIPLSASIDWQEPTSVIRWAWETAQRIAIWETENHQPNIRNGMFMYEAGALCQACMKFSVLPEVTDRNRKIIGYSCINEGCPARHVRIPKVLVEKNDEKPLGLAFTSFLMELKEKHDKGSDILDVLVSLAQELSVSVSLKKGDSHCGKLILSWLCIKCENPITGILKNQKDKMNVCFSDYVYLSIYSKTGLCINCIDEFMGSMNSILNK